VKQKWYGIPPKKCDICGTALKRFFIDGRTDTGAWANMCERCHKERGVGLGIGKGQKYELKVIKDGDKEWIRVKKMH
jgi:hypothetical protein